MHLRARPRPDARAGGGARHRGAYIHGSWAARREGDPGGQPRDIDVLVVGCAARAELNDASAAAEERLHMPVSITKVSAEAWARARIRSSSRFGRGRCPGSTSARESPPDRTWGAGPGDDRRPAGGSATRARRTKQGARGRSPRPGAPLPRDHHRQRRGRPHRELPARLRRRPQGPRRDPRQPGPALARRRSPCGRSHRRSRRVRPPDGPRSAPLRLAAPDPQLRRTPDAGRSTDHAG